MLTGKIHLERKLKSYNASYCMLKGNLEDIKEYTSLLHVKEAEYYTTLKIDKRKLSYLQSRITAKMAFSEFTEGIDKKSIFIDFGVFQFPVVDCPINNNMKVTISHCSDIGLAISYPEAHPMGIDIERFDSEGVSAIKCHAIDKEISLLNFNNLKENIGHTLIWTIKESLSKVLKVGLTLDLKILALDSLLKKGNLYESTFVNFGQYKAVSCIFESFVCSIVLPKNTTPNLSNFWDALHTLSVTEKQNQ